MSGFFSWLVHSVYPDAKIAPRPKRSGEAPSAPAAGEPAEAVSALDASIEKAKAKLEARAEKNAAPGRQELLRQVMDIHRSKQSVFAGLSEEERQKLTVLAIQALIKPMEKSGK